MLRMRRIEIENFACFDRIVVEPSANPDYPMTVIRAENGSGKTTFLRAVRWGMYSEKGLPGDAARFSLHPAWWSPEEAGITTKVAIEFETDGASRHDSEGADLSTVYQFVRSVTTVGKPATKDDEPDFRRINDQAQLMVREADGTWNPHQAAVDAVIEQLLPWDLRDFFVMDADEAADFVGGSEGQVMSHKDVEAKTTAAIHSLLGIDIFNRASGRVAAIGKAFGAAATKAVGDADLDAMQIEVDQLRDDRDNRVRQISEANEQIADLQGQIDRANDNLERELKDIGAAEQIRARRKNNRASFATASKARTRTLAELANELASTMLLAPLAAVGITGAHGMLKPLYDSGRIPQKHLLFVRQLLESGTCICGQDLERDGLHRHHVADLLADTAENEKRADYLGHLYEAARGLFYHTNHGPAWEKRCHDLSGQLAEVDEELETLRFEYRDIEAKLDALDEEHIQIIRNELDTLNTLISNRRRSVVLNEHELPGLDSSVNSLDKQIHQRNRNERAAKDKQVAQNLADLVTQVLDGAYQTIQFKQVEELSRKMNRLFANMAENVADDDYEEAQGSKATLRMFSEVGVRRVKEQSKQFEIYALNARGRAMSAFEINGASRRVLALSFVLALCSESRTEAPLLADSLLNSMSGAVRRNTLRATAENSGQPILLLTGSDLETQSEVEIVAEKAGVTYTLTGQWSAIDAGDGGDVVNWTDQRRVSLLCECAPREFCDVCERTGQAGSPGWSKRN